MDYTRMAIVATLEMIVKVGAARDRSIAYVDHVNGYANQS